jgi:hypothetical protein
MEAAANGGGGNGIFAAAVDADDGLMAAASTATGQLRTTTTIAAATIRRESHCRQCHCVIAPLSHRRLCQQRLPLMKTTIAIAVLLMVNGGGGLC